MRAKRLWTPDYHSVLATWICRFIEEKRAAGFRYESAAYYLLEFDRFLIERDYASTALSKEIVEAWTARRDAECASTQRARVYVLLQFAKFLLRQGLPAYLSPRQSLPVVHDTFMPYIFTPAQMASIFAALDRMQLDRYSLLRHIVMPEIFRVLYGCELRMREALQLRICDVDLMGGVLTIRDTKFGKDRLVPMAPILTARLRRYRDLLGPLCDDAFFFPSLDGGRYCQYSIYSLFRQITTQVGIVRDERNPGVRVHDLRHTMAITRLKQWYQEGACLEDKLAVLSTYLGHRKVQATQRYLKWLPVIFPEIVTTMESSTGTIIPVRRS